jgi:hypothetical protein
MTWRSRKGMLTAGGFAAIVMVALSLIGDDDVTPTAALAPGRAPVAGRASGNVAVSGLKLELLEQRHAELTDPERDPFRFQARQTAPRPAAAAPPPVASTLEVTGPPVPAVPAGPPPPPPISLRFIGLLDAPSQSGRVAILSDGRGNVVYGKEGDTIEGRYRLLKVGADAVELAYVDGRGRQTVRLAGQ